MPSNVSFEFALAQKKYDAARTPEEKLIALQEMKSAAPSHKGAENLRSEINRQLSSLRAKMERQKSQSKRGSAPTIYVKKEGVGQIVLVGPPNGGKSWLLNKIVGREIAEVTPYPFATKIPVPAMLDYAGGKVQIVEVPAIIQGSAQGRAQGKEILSIIRTADSVVLVCSEEERQMLVNELALSNIVVGRDRPRIEVKHSEFQGIQISGKRFLNFPIGQLEGYLKNIGYSNSSVIISGPINSLTDVSEAMNERLTYKPCLVVNPNKISDHDLLDLRDQLFLSLNKILVYTKKPGHDAEMTAPLSMQKGSTVTDLAKSLHKDFARNLKFARVWGSAKFPGQRVGPEYVLKHRDIVEISI
ncbi:MAG: TGS domain-containing protein [Candidatus Diapherotrites archaeon]|nr:TGS domain-containing protein [Candidatus Diapherotrites archaeon]